MKLIGLASAFVATAGVLAGCSEGDTEPAGDTEYVVRDGHAYCAFTASDSELRFGVVEGDNVKIHPTFGGETLSASEVEARLLAIEVEGNESFEDKEVLLYEALTGPPPTEE